MINELLQNKALIFSIISVVIVTILFIIYLILKERKQDQDEIDDIMYSLVDDEDASEDEDVKLEEDNEDKKGMDMVVKDEVEKDNVSDDTLDIASMLEQMQKDLNAKAEDVVATFEQEQEENSIISYQELVNSLKGKRNENASFTTASEVPKVSNEKIEKAVIEKPIVANNDVHDSEVHSEQLSIDNVLSEEKNNSVKKFKNTDFISPVYGKMDEHLEYPTVPQFHKTEDEIEKELETYDSSLENKNIDNFLGDIDFDSSMEINSLEQTLDMEPLSNDIKANDEFLKALKDFRKNLD